MRVLWITDLFPHAGRPYKGAWLVELAKALSRHAEITVLSPRYRFLWTPRGSFLEWYRGQPRRMDYGPVRAFYPSAPAIPVAFYMFMQSLSMAAALLPVAREEHARRPFDVIHGQPIIPGGSAAAWIARRLSVPLVVTGQGADVNEFSRIPHLRRFFATACRRARCITAVSRDLVSQLATLGFPGARWIPNGCLSSENRDQGRSRGRILFVGALYERKAPEVLLRAFETVLREMPEATLDIVGEGSEAGSLEDQAGRAGIGSAFRFLGPLPHGAVRRHMETSDVFCLPSRREGWPLVVLEAMAAGLPVIGSDIGGTREIVKRKELGELVPAGDAGALARALISALRNRWDRESIRAAVQEYSWDRIADRYMDVYREAIASRRTRSSSAAMAGAE